MQQVRTRDGAICLYARREVLLADSGRPVLVMIHGALRNSSVLFGWIDLCAPDLDVAFVDLPGHGHSQAGGPVTVEALAANVADAISGVLGDRTVVVVGESLGGLVALAMAGSKEGPVQAVIAADPPLSTAKLWHIRTALIDAMQKDAENQFLRSLALNIFGFGADGSVHERLYYNFIEQAQLPMLILTGDVPLFPMRNVNAVPCLVDAVDRYVIGQASKGKARVELVADCGHVLLVDAAQQCRSIIGRYCTAILAKA